MEKARAPAAGNEVNCSEIATLVQRVLKEADVPGASVAVVENDQLKCAVSRGLADLSTQSPVTDETRFPLASLSKQFVAVAIMMLVEDGKLRLDEPVSRFYPQLQASKEITIRNLLTHTSGYRDYWSQTYMLSEKETPRTPDSIIEEYAAKTPLDFKPGTKFTYSNTNYQILGRIIEKTSGLSLFQFLKLRIFVPLEMKSASDYDEGSTDAKGSNKIGVNPLEPAPRPNRGWLFGAGELSMTASDLAKWDIAYLERKLLRPSSYRIIETETLLKNGLATGYGLGVWLAEKDGHKVLTYTGNIPGFSSRNQIFPNDRGAVIVLLNFNSANATRIISSHASQFIFAKNQAKLLDSESKARKLLSDFEAGIFEPSQFTSNALSYFSEKKRAEIKRGLMGLGSSSSITRNFQYESGPLTVTNYIVKFPIKTLEIWMEESSDGRIEEFSLLPHVEIE